VIRLDESIFGNLGESFSFQSTHSQFGTRPARQIIPDPNTISNQDVYPNGNNDTKYGSLAYTIKARWDIYSQSRPHLA
jgi:hypothetical protein